MIRLAHIIHPVVIAPPSDLVVAQPITFETMRRARAYAHEKASPPVQVSLHATQYRDEERLDLPDCFARVPDLRRDVSDVVRFDRPWKIALLADILGSLRESGACADYFIYTNVDIALQEHFYLAVAAIIDEGYDAFVINRRSIPDHYSSIDEIPLMCEEKGLPHKGYDCFVFKAESLPAYELGQVCLGTPWVDRALLANLVTFSTKFKEFKEEHLTFHIGNTRQWLSKEFDDYVEHNRQEYLAVFPVLEALHGGFDPVWRSYLLDRGEGMRQYPLFDAASR